MKYIVLISLLFSNFAFAKSNWSDQEVGTEYKLDRSITLRVDESQYTLPAGTKFELVKKEALNMLKVYFHQYKINNCPSSRLETDLELVQVGSSSIGVNLAKGCIVEVYVDLPDYDSLSFLN